MGDAIKNEDDELITFRRLRTVNLDSFIHDLSLALSNTTNFQKTSFSNTCSSFNHALSTTLDKHAPVVHKKKKRKPQSNSKDPVWFDQDYTNARAKRRKLENIYKGTLLPSDKQRYNEQSRLCQRMAKEKRIISVDAEISSIAGNRKALFKYVSNLSHPSNSGPVLPSNYNDEFSLANDMNHFFINKVQNIRDSFLNNHSSNMEFQCSTTMPPVVTPDNSTSSSLSEFIPCTDNEIKDILKSTGFKVAPSDILPTQLLSASKDVLIPHLTSLVNLSLSTGCFESIKEGIICPSLKSMTVDHNLFSNYRPISNLPFLSKLIERVVLSRLQSHLHYINFANHTQYGYKKKHSTETLLVKFLNDILVGIDKNTGTVVLLTDLSAAFDTVDHRRLLNILSHELNINGKAFQWFKSFLLNRTQRVLVGTTLSDPLELSFGVPQGSVLGPVLFNIYVHSLSSVFSQSGFQNLSYADDNAGYLAFSLPLQDKFSTIG